MGVINIAKIECAGTGREGQGLSCGEHKHYQKGNILSCVRGKRRENNVLRTTGFGGGSQDYW